MHVLTPESAPSGDVSPRVGLVVSKAVGGAVVRHRVSRRLRHVMRDRLSRLPAGSRVVIRALPRSADAESARLAAEVDRALRVLLPRAGGSAAGYSATDRSVANGSVAGGFAAGGRDGAVAG
jgi:ribonuclease P protein component